MIMERKIGKIFEYNGEWYQCVKSDDTCNGCVGKFQPYSFCNDFKECVGKIFKKLEKVGDPYIIGNKLIQRYKIYPTTYHINVYGWYYHNLDVKSWTIDVEIEQNKEDMSNTETLWYGPDKKKEAKSLELSNLKPFSLEAAKAGKPVCTRDGRKARIICFDRISGDDYYKIVACVTAFDGNFEEVLFYGIDGYIVDSQNPKDEDLMMLTEKKEGWVNVYKGGLLDTKSYPTKKEAFDKACPEGYVDTVKVCWEE